MTTTYSERGDNPSKVAGNPCVRYAACTSAGRYVNKLYRRVGYWVWVVSLVVILLITVPLHLVGVEVDRGDGGAIDIVGCVSGVGGVFNVVGIGSTAGTGFVYSHGNLSIEFAGV